MGRKSLKEVRQKEIIEAFYKVAKEIGLENTSLAKVAKEMGVNTSLVLHYFESKDELIFGLINYILEQYSVIYDAGLESTNGESRLEAVLNNLFSREWNDLIDDSVFYSSFSLIFRSAEIKAAYRDLHESLREWLAQIIKRAKENGEVQVADPKESADLIFIMVEGVYYYLSLYDIDEEYFAKLAKYREAAFNLLGLPAEKSN